MKTKEKKIKPFIIKTKWYNPNWKFPSSEYIEGYVEGQADLMREIFTFVIPVISFAIAITGLIAYAIWRLI